MQELNKSIKRPNLRITDIGEGENVQAKGILNILNNIITEHFPNFKKVLPIQVQEAFRTPNRLGQIELAHGILTLKQQTQKREREY
jgi:hypothetical protein